VRAPLAGKSAGMPSPPPHCRGSEWPRARTDATTGGDGETASVATGVAGTGRRSGTSAFAWPTPPGRARMRGQKAGAGGNPAEARRLRTCRRRVAVMEQCRCALRRTTSVGSPLRGLPLTRFPGRGRCGRPRDPRRRCPRSSPRRNSPPRRLLRPGTPGHPFPRRGKRQPCPAGRSHGGRRSAVPVEPAVPRPGAGVPVALVPARCGVPRLPRAARARGPAPRETARGTPTTSAPGGHRTSRPPADAAGAPPRVPHSIRRHAVEAPRHGETAGGDPSAGRRFPPVAAPGCPAPGCRARAPPPCERGTTPGARPTRAADVSPTRAADCPPVIPGRRPGTRTQRAFLTRPTPRPTRPAPPRHRSP